VAPGGDNQLSLTVWTDLTWTIFPPSVMGCFMRLLASLTNKAFFRDPLLRKRYLLALCLITLMVAAAEVLGQREIIFPEMAALTIGLWIANEKIWVVTKWQTIVILTLGASFGVIVDRYSPFPLVIDLALAFCFAAICLMATRATLWPLISACMLPVLIHTESWIYPEAVFVMASLVAIGQLWMEKKGWRVKTAYAPRSTPLKNEALKFLKLLAWVLPIIALAVFTSNLHFILPPLIVIYVEFSTTTAKLRNRPLEIYFLSILAALIGVVCQLIGHFYLGLPETLVALLITAIMFALFEWWGKLPPPVGAVALIPLILPRESLLWLPLRVAVGVGLLIMFSLIAYHHGYLWKRVKLYLRWSRFYINKK
jgi:hypothetical protein